MASSFGFGTRSLLHGPRRGSNLLKPRRRAREFHAHQPVDWHPPPAHGLGLAPLWRSRSMADSGTDTCQSAAARSSRLIVTLASWPWLWKRNVHVEPWSRTARYSRVTPLSTKAIGSQPPPSPGATSTPMSNSLELLMVR